MMKAGWLNRLYMKMARQQIAIFALVFACILLPVQSDAQTCVIAKKTKRAIYVGADSRVGRYTRNVVTKEVYFDTFSICKIYHAGNNNFALIGAYIQEAKDLALTQCAAGYSFDTLIKKYAKSFDSVLSRQLSVIKQQNPPVYQNILASNNPFVSQIIFFGVDHDTLAMKHIGFRVVPNPSSLINNTVTVRHLSGFFNPDAAGHIEEIKDTLTTKHVFKKGVKKTINRLIHTEATFHPMEVGGAIDIIKVKRRKTRWLQKKQSC